MTIQDDPMPSHYCVSCVGYPFNTESSTRYLLSRVAAAPQHRHTSVVTSRLKSVNRHFTSLPSHYLTSHLPGQTLRDEPFAVLCQLSLPETIISVDSLSVVKSRLKTYFFRKAFDKTATTDLPTVPLKPRP